MRGVIDVYKRQDKKLRVKVEGVDLTGKTVEVQTLAGESFVDENSLAEPEHCIDVFLLGYE